MSVTDRIDASALFGLAPDKAVEYLDSKGLKVGWNWQDTLDEAHARSFTIAKMTELDLLSDTRKAIMQSMRDGTGFKNFEQTIAPVMQAKGWWGKKEVINPEGDKQVVQLGSPRRLATIYHTNRRAAVMAAKYQRMYEATDTHPYWQYTAIMDGLTRAIHAMMNGAVYAADDPFWVSNFPPNGYNCRCTVKPLTATRAEKAGILKSDMHQRTENIGLNRSTGEVYQATRYGTQVPEKTGRNVVFAADAGFNGSPAAGHLMDQLWLDKARTALGDKPALDAIAADMASDARVRGFLAWARTTMEMRFSQNRTYGVGVLSEKAMGKFKVALGDKSIGSPVVAYQDHLIAGKKARRHEAVGDALDLAGYERLIRGFGKPDYELWDAQYKHILHVYTMGDGRALKLSMSMTEQGAMVDSAFYVPMVAIKGAIKGGALIPIQ